MSSMSTRRNSILILLALLGAILIAPCVSALQGTPNLVSVAPDYFNTVNLEELRQACVEKILANYVEDGDDLKYITFNCDNNSQYGDGYTMAFIGTEIPSSIWVGSNSNAYLQTSDSNTNSPFTGDPRTYLCLLKWSAQNEIYSVDHVETGTYGSLAWSRTYGIVTNYETTVISDNNAFLYDPLPLTGYENINYTKFEPMLVDYLKDYNFDCVKAELSDNGEVTATLPIVTSSTELSTEYSGLYVLRMPDDFFFHFKIARTPDVSAADLEEYWNDYLTFTFSTGDSTEFNYIYGVEHPLPVSENTNGDTSFLAFMANQRLLNAHYSFTTATQATVNGDEVTFGQLWRYTNITPYSHIIIPDVYIAMNYKNVQNGTDVSGTDSDTYNDYKTTYYNNKYNLAMEGMTGYITGETSFSADYSRQMPDTTIDYKDNIQSFDDHGFKAFFQRIWNIGDGYFTSLLLAILAVAFAAYLIYGRNKS